MSDENVEQLYNELMILEDPKAFFTKLIYLDPQLIQFLVLKSDADNDKLLKKFLDVKKANPGLAEQVRTEQEQNEREVSKDAC